jgi:putative colanic acid biosynthesis acetyltransferase WcaF
MDEIKKVDFSKFNNDWYDPGKNSMIRIIWYFVNMAIFKSYLFPLYGVKASILRLFGAKIGRNFVIKPNVNIKYPWKLSIGNNVWIGEEVWIDNLDQIYIEDNVCVSQGAMLLTGNHNYKNSTFDLIINKIILKEGVWIGARSVVCPGVICNSHAILSVGSVANNELEAYTIYQGVPAVAVRKRVITK